MAHIPAQAQPELFPSEAAKALMNQNRVGIVTGGPGGTYARLGFDLSSLLNDYSSASPFRVVVSLSQGSWTNLADVLNFKLVDFAIVQSDVLEQFRANPADYGRLKRELRLVAPLHKEAIHILARGNVRTLAGLKDKTVNIDAPGSGTQITAGNLFRLAGLRPTLTDRSSDQAVKALLDGSIDAMVYVVGKGATLFKSIDGDQAQRAGLGFVPIDPGIPGIDQYAPVDLGSEDYSNIIAQGEPPVATRAVTAILVMYNFQNQKDSVRLTAEKTFIDRFFRGAGRLTAGPYSRAWCDVDLAGTVPQWDRDTVAAGWLRAYPAAPTRLCAVHPENCDCARVSGLSGALSCEAGFRQDYQSHGGSPPNIADRDIRPMYEIWRRDHPNCVP